MKQKFNLYSLSRETQKKVNAGNICGCGCNYADSGGSSVTDNGNANHDGGDGLWSPDGIVEIVI